MIRLFLGYAPGAPGTYGPTRARLLAGLVNHPDAGPTWDDLRVSLSTAKPGATNPPGYQKFRDNGSGSTGVFAYFFDKSVREEVFFEVQLPHGYVEGSELRPHIHWSPTDVGTGIARWGMEYSVSNVNSPFPLTSIIYAEDAGDGVANNQQIGAFTPIDGTGLGISAVLACRLFRDASHANDTYGADAVGVSVDFHVLTDARGSREEYSK